MQKNILKFLNVKEEIITPYLDKVYNEECKRFLILPIG